MKLIMENWRNFRSSKLWEASLKDDSNAPLEGCASSPRCLEAREWLLPKPGGIIDRWAQAQGLTFAVIMNPWGNRKLSNDENYTGRNAHRQKIIIQGANNDPSVYHHSNRPGDIAGQAWDAYLEEIGGPQHPDYDAIMQKEKQTIVEATEEMTKIDLSFNLKSGFLPRHNPRFKVIFFPAHSNKTLEAAGADSAVGSGMVLGTHEGDGTGGVEGAVKFVLQREAEGDAGANVYNHPAVRSVGYEPQRPVPSGGDPARDGEQDLRALDRIPLCNVDRIWPNGFQG